MMGNASATSRTITLHCYAPPYHQCHKFDLEGNKQIVDMQVVNHLDLQKDDFFSSTISLPSVEALTEALNKEFAKDTIDSDEILRVLNSFQFNPK